MALSLHKGLVLVSLVSFAVFLLIRAINQLNRKEEEQQSEPTTKDCPFCFSSIPSKATRCAHCTSDLQSD